MVERRSADHGLIDGWTAGLGGPRSRKKCMDDNVTSIPSRTMFAAAWSFIAVSFSITHIACCRADS